MTHRIVYMPGSYMPEVDDREPNAEYRPLPVHPVVYDLSTDEFRPVTQTDIDELCQIRNDYTRLIQLFNSQRDARLAKQGKCIQIVDAK